MHMLIILIWIFFGIDTNIHLSLFCLLFYMAHLNRNTQFYAIILFQKHMKINGNWSITTNLSHKWLIISLNRNEGLEIRYNRLYFVTKYLIGVILVGVLTWPCQGKQSCWFKGLITGNRCSFVKIYFIKYHTVFSLMYIYKWIQISCIKLPISLDYVNLMMIIVIIWIYKFLFKHWLNIHYLGCWVSSVIFYRVRNLKLGSWYDCTRHTSIRCKRMK